MVTDASHGTHYVLYLVKGLHLTSMKPGHHKGAAPSVDAAQKYAAALFPYLFDFMTSDAPSSTWVAARQRFEQALVSYGLR